LRPGDAYIITFILLLAVIFFGYVWPTFRLFRSFDRIEQNAKRRITARELQAWGTNLLAQQPLGQYRYRVAELGTNFPKQLLGLWKNPPDVIVYKLSTNNSGTVAPGWVYIAWGSGFMGQSGFEIGPTNFISYKGGHEWSDGVYFRRK